jgi:hypothetical protein
MVQVEAQLAVLDADDAVDAGGEACEPGWRPSSQIADL